MPTYIGLSVSSCCRDLARGKLRTDQVECIIAGGNFDIENPDDIDEVCRVYNRITWRNDPVAESIFRELLEQGKIYVPRAHGYDPPNVSHGFWIVRF